MLVQIKAIGIHTYAYKYKHWNESDRLFNAPVNNCGCDSTAYVCMYVLMYVCMLLN